MTSRPNLLFLMSDSMDGRVVDPHSPISAWVRTPTLDALAADGVSFVRTYAASPQCVPSRTSMLTGRRTDQIRAYSNDDGLTLDRTGAPDQACAKAYGTPWCLAIGARQDANATFFDALADGGYEMAIFGKVDVGANIIARFGPAPTETGFHGGPNIPTLTRAADIRRPTKPNPMLLTNDQASSVHPEDWRIHDKCIEWLVAKGKAAGLRMTSSERKSSSGIRPWFMYCSLNIPHPPFKTNQTWLESVDEKSVHYSPPTWTSLSSMHPYDSFMSIAKGLGDDQPPFSSFDIFKVRRTYLAMVAEADYLLGEVLSACKKADLYQKTIIIFLSDHGEMNMGHRQIWKNSLYEGSVRVPLIISGGALNLLHAKPFERRAMGTRAQREHVAFASIVSQASDSASAAFAPEPHRGSLVTDLVSLLDIYPTLLDLAQLPQQPADWLAGTSLAPLLGVTHSVSADQWSTNDGTLAHTAAPRKTYVVSQFHSNLGNTGSFCIVKGSLKYIVFGTRALNVTFGGYMPQLFDLSVDPEELVDISLSRPADVKRLDALLREELASGYNAISPGAGDYNEIDAEVKRQQQLTFLTYFVSDASKLRAQWLRMTRCDDEMKAALAAGENPIARVYATDEGTEAPCAANDTPLDRDAAESFFSLIEAESPLDKSIGLIDPAARIHHHSSLDAIEDLVSVADSKIQSHGSTASRIPLRQILARSYTGFDGSDWRKIKWWATQRF